MVAMAHLQGLSSMPIIPRYAATASTPSTKCCSVWATTSRSSEIGLDEAVLGPSRRAQAVPLCPEQGLQEERVQQGALGVALPDAA